MLFRLVFSAALLLSNALALANVAPEFLEPGGHRAVRSGGAAQDFDLRSLFRDPDVPGSAVRVSVRLGATIKPVDIALFDQQKPITVANFLAYVNSGRFAANFFHRSVPGFVVQGGGFAWDAADQVGPVPTFAQIQNEPGISNLRGTIAMAKLGGDPNSATSQWFVNLADNSANLDAQNGGFTVFGRVIGTGMSVIDEVAALPRYNAGSPFDTLPLKDFPGGTIQRVHTVETDAAVIPTLNFQAVSNDPSLVDVSVTGSTLRLTPSATQTGTATVTLTATDLEGGITEAVLAVHVLAKSYGWAVEDGANGEPAAFRLNPSETLVPPSDPVPVAWGAVPVGSSATQTFTVTNNGATPLENLTVTIQGANPADFQITAGAGPVGVAPGANVTFTAKFTPGSHGVRSAVLRVAGVEPSEAILDLAVSGTGIDTTPPSVTSATPQTLLAGANRSAQIPDWRGTLVTANDDAGVVSFTQSPAPGSFQPIGEYPLIFTASDAAGNVASTESTLTVQYAAATLPAVQVSAAHGNAPVPAEGGADLPPGSFLSAFGTPAISDDRSLAARVTITAGRAKLDGIYFENAAGENRLVARQGQASGLPNALFKRFRDPLLSDDGAIAFAATLTGVKATENEGLWTDLFGALELVLRKTFDLPGQAGLKLKSIASLSFDDDALLATVKLVRVPGVITAANDSALIRITSPTSSVVLARTGASFDGSTIKQISVLQPAAHSPGQGRWNGANGTVAKLTLIDRRSVIVRLLADGTQIPLLRTGTPDPNLGSTLATLGLPSIGGAGVAVLTTLPKQAGVVSAANDALLIYAADGTTFDEVVREEPGAANFATFSDPVANDQGELLFSGTLRAAVPTTPNTTALWLANGATAPEIVAQIGAPGVDRAGQPMPDAAWSAFKSFALPNGPNAGPIFVAQLSGKAVNSQSKLGLWALDSGGMVKLLLRAGEDVTLPTGTKRLTKFSVLNALPGSFGARRSYNSTGAVAVQATFADRTQAVLRIDVP